MSRSDDARAALLDAAERLFAEHGISGVSDRRIAEEAGQRNHSAVAYHFGGRPGLLDALIERHTWAQEQQREKYFAASRSLLGDVCSLVLPATDTLAALPAPTWRARFVARALFHQETGELLRTGLSRTPAIRSIGDSILGRLDHLDRAVADARIALTTQVVVTCCADVERGAAAGREPRWPDVGLFLAESITGMLQAPSSQPGYRPTGPTASSDADDDHPG